MFDRKPTSVVLPAVLVLTLLGLYVGAYYGLVDRNALGPDPDASVYVAFYPVTNRSQSRRFNMQHGGHFWMARQTLANDRMTLFFAPVHWLDRRIRPQFWITNP